MNMSHAFHSLQLKTGKHGVSKSTYKFFGKKREKENGAQ
jgi:hypothetical protein